MSIQKQLKHLKSTALKWGNKLRNMPLWLAWSIYLILALIMLIAAWRGDILRTTTRISSQNQKDSTIINMSNEVFWDFKLTPPELGENNQPSFLLKFIEVYFPQETTVFPDQFCIDEAYYYENVFLNQREYTISVKNIHKLEEPSICLELENTNLDVSVDNKKYWIFRYMAEIISPIELTSASSPNMYYYPYDSFNTDITFQLKYRILSQGEEIRSGLVSPNLGVSNFLLTSSWDIGVVSSEFRSDEIETQYVSFQNLDRLEKYNVLTLRYDRPFITRLIYPIIFLSMLVFIILLSYVKDIGSFVQGSAGVLFGMFGARSVLIDAPIPQGRTITDVLFMLLYLAFAVSVLIFILRQWNGNEKTTP